MGSFQRIKMKTFFILAFFAASAFAARVNEIHTYTDPDGFGSGMGFLGQMHVEIIAPDGSSCDVFDLNVDSGDVFHDQELGECFGFFLPENDISKFKVYHTGSD